MKTNGLLVLKNDFQVGHVGRTSELSETVFPQEKGWDEGDKVVSGKWKEVVGWGYA